MIIYLSIIYPQIVINLWFAGKLMVSI